jgi:hypothetical protein
MEFIDSYQGKLWLFWKSLWSRNVATANLRSRRQGDRVINIDVSGLLVCCQFLQLTKSYWEKEGKECSVLKIPIEHKGGEAGERSICRGKERISNNFPIPQRNEFF